MGSWQISLMNQRTTKNKTQMAQDTENTLRKYTKIRESYDKWINDTYKGVRKYTDEYIFLKLEEDFFLRPKTIEDIVYYRTKI